MASLWQDDTLRFYLLMAACLLLMYLPVAGRYCRMLATMVHEGGHVLVALLLGEKPQTVSLFKDTSGVAMVKTSARWKAVLVAMAGYLFTPLLAYMNFWLLQKGYEQVCLWSVATLTAVFLLCYIRNCFGVLWSLSFIALHVLVLFKGGFFWMEVLARLDASTLFVDAVCSCLILLKVALRNPKQSGDAYNLSRLIHVPPLLTALLFTAFAIFMDYCCIMNFFPKI